MSSPIRTLRMFLIVVIALNPRSQAAVDGLIVNINLTNIMMYCKLSGVSAIRLQKVSNGARRFFFVSRSFISDHSSTIFCMQSLPSMSAKCWHSEMRRFCHFHGLGSLRHWMMDGPDNRRSGNLRRVLHSECRTSSEER